SPDRAVAACCSLRVVVPAEAEAAGVAPAAFPLPAVFEDDPPCASTSATTTMTPTPPATAKGTSGRLPRNPLPPPAPPPSGCPSGPYWTPGQNCPGGNCPGGNCPGGNCSCPFPYGPGYAPL